MEKINIQSNLKEAEPFDTKLSLKEVLHLRGVLKTSENVQFARINLDENEFCADNYEDGVTTKLIIAYFTRSSDVEEILDEYKRKLAYVIEEEDYHKYFTNYEKYDDQLKSIVEKNNEEENKNIEFYSSEEYIDSFNFLLSKFISKIYNDNKLIREEKQLIITFSDLCLAILGTNTPNELYSFNKILKYMLSLKSNQRINLYSLKECIVYSKYFEDIENLSLDIELKDERDSIMILTFKF